MRRLVRFVTWGLLLLAASCNRGGIGKGEVSGSFFVRECSSGGDRALAPYSFSADLLGTRRLRENLQIALYDDAVDFEETDALLILIGNVDPLLADPTRPLVRRVSRDPADVNLALSLFVTCPKRPTLHGLSGEIRFEKFDIASDPADTGRQEALAGTLTASVVSADLTEAAGSIELSFDFIPGDPPLLLR